MLQIIRRANGLKLAKSEFRLKFASCTAFVCGLLVIESPDHHAKHDCYRSLQECLNGDSEGLEEITSNHGQTSPSQREDRSIVKTPSSSGKCIKCSQSRAISFTTFLLEGLLVRASKTLILATAQQSQILYLVLTVRIQPCSGSSTRPGVQAQ